MSEVVVEQESIGVLLVDDHPVVRDGYRRLLDAAPGIRVIGEADDGAAALQLYDTLQPDVLVLDLSMPGIGGLETLRRLLNRDPDARVLVFSMHESEVLIERALEAGALGYLTKSSAAERMVEAVRQVAQGDTYLQPEFLPEIVRNRLGATDPTRVLSRREFQIFQLLAEGRPVIEIAEILSISPKTAGVHQTAVLKKLRARNSAQLARIAIRYGVINP